MLMYLYLFVLQASAFGEKSCWPCPHHSSFLVILVFSNSPMPHIFSKICGQVSSIVLHPFSSIVEGKNPQWWKERCVWIPSKLELILTPNSSSCEMLKPTNWPYPPSCEDSSTSIWLMNLFARRYNERRKRYECKSSRCQASPWPTKKCWNFWPSTAWLDAL